VQASPASPSSSAGRWTSNSGSLGAMSEVAEQPGLPPLGPSGMRSRLRPSMDRDELCFFGEPGISENGRHSVGVSLCRLASGNGLPACCNAPPQPCLCPCASAACERTCSPTAQRERRAGLPETTSIASGDDSTRLFRVRAAYSLQPGRA
jgi:hypothetical protein